ncbi:unnamed protein product [Porites lobata]|uniref:Contactin-associated protein-like 2 n=1 Tax=Porites lobata TaxID=104759 RepID=A0ABN8REU5_9CNID|nr:unnamed protein product [Porites lobata]
MIANKMVCELSNSDHLQHAEDLKPRKDWIYRGTQCDYLTFLSHVLHNTRTRIAQFEKAKDWIKIGLSCSHLKKGDPTAASGNYNIDPDGEGDLEPFSVYCDMTNKNGVGVTIIRHDSESRSIVDGYEDHGSYSRDINYAGASLSQLASFTNVSSHCEQFIKYECRRSLLLHRLANEFSYKASCEAAILSFKPRALIVSSLDQCTRNRAAVPRVKPLNRSHGWRDYCVLQGTKSGLLVLKVQLYLAEYQDNHEKKKKLPKQNDDNSCSSIKKFFPAAESGNYDIDPDSEGGLAPFTVYCDMTGKNGVGVTVISHDSESTTKVRDGLGWGGRGSYRRDIHYTGASLSQLASLTSVSSHCEQFIKYECYHSMILRSGYAWWVSRDSSKMTYWGGALPGSGKCACGMNNTCANPIYGCNCDKNDPVWREDSGLLIDKTKLPVKQLVHGDAGNDNQGYHTLGKLKCYGIA